MTWAPDLCRATEPRMSRRTGVFRVRCELPLDHGVRRHEALGIVFAAWTTSAAASVAQPQVVVEVKS